MKAIILVGGFGTRLRSILTDVPKPMAPIENKPFLAYLLDYLQTQGMTEVVFCAHYLGEQIQAYFHDQYNNLIIRYVMEEEPLGTGGAIVNALSTITTTEPIFVLNGDTFVKIDYRAMYIEHLMQEAKLTLALRHVADCSRYGKVVVTNHCITAFKEKGETGEGYINAGVYVINPDLFNQAILPQHFSFERDFLYPYLPLLKPQAFIADGYFIDIGIPEDYLRAQKDLPALFN